MKLLLRSCLGLRLHWGLGRIAPGRSRAQLRGTHKGIGADPVFGGAADPGYGLPAVFEILALLCFSRMTGDGQPAWCCP